MYVGLIAHLICLSAGWLGETYTGGKHPSSTDSNDDPSGLRVLSWEPRIMHYRRFLTEDECDYLMKTAKPRLKRSSVADAVTGQHKQSEVRTSSGMFFDRGEDEVVKRVEARVAMVTMLPVGNAEGMQVLHYGVSEVCRSSTGNQLHFSCTIYHCNVFV